MGQWIYANDSYSKDRWVHVDHSNENSFFAIWCKFCRMLPWATLKCSTRHCLFVFSYLCSPWSLLCSPQSLFCSPKNLNFQEVYYVLLEVYCVLLEVYCVLLKVYYVLLEVYCVPLEVYCVLLEVYCVLLEVYYVLLEVYCVLLEAYCVLLGSLLCSTQNFSLTQENTFRHPKSASLLVFYSGEHFTTIQNLQVYFCSTQENTLRQSKIIKFNLT